MVSLFHHLQRGWDWHHFCKVVAKQSPGCCCQRKTPLSRCEEGGRLTWARGPGDGHCPFPCSLQWVLHHLHSQLSSHSSWPSNDVPLSDLACHLPHYCLATLMSLLSGLCLSSTLWQELLFLLRRDSTSIKFHFLANVLSVFQVPLPCFGLGFRRPRWEDFFSFYMFSYK